MPVVTTAAVTAAPQGNSAPASRPSLLRQFASWWVPPRRVKPTKAGWLFTGLSAAVAIAALNTGNNVLYILLGLHFGIVTTSGLWSETVLRKLDAEFAPPSWLPAGVPVTLRYRFDLRGRRLPAYLLQVFPDIRRDGDIPVTFWQRWRRSRWWTPLYRKESGVRVVSSPWIRHLPKGETVEGHVEVQFDRRGIYRLLHAETGTMFPFGIIEKRRRNDQNVELVVAPPLADASDLDTAESAGTDSETAGRRLDPAGEFDGLRPFQAGDSPRLISWKTTARTGQLTVRLHREVLSPEIAVVLEPFTGRPEELANPPEQRRLDRQVSIARTLVETLRSEGYRVQLHDSPQASSGLSDAEARLLAAWQGEGLPQPPAAKGPGDRVTVTRTGKIVKAG